MQIDWTQAAKAFLENTKKTQAFLQPPATSCFVQWRDEIKVGAIQFPVHPKYPAVIFLSITSRHVHPDFIAALKQMDPDRLELQADAVLDLTGNFHILRRDGPKLSILTPEETKAIQQQTRHVLQVEPRENGIHIESIPSRKDHLY